MGTLARNGLKKNMQKQPPEVFHKKGVLKSFRKLTGKHGLF